MVPLDAGSKVGTFLGPVARRFSHEQSAWDALRIDPGERHVVTGFGPTNAPTAGTLSVMFGLVELERRLESPATAIISELGAWNSRNVPWRDLILVRDGMMAFLRDLGFRGEIRGQLDHANLVRAGRIARYLSLADFYENREELTNLYGELGLLGSDVGVVVDALYTVADVLGPAESDARAILMVAGLEESYFAALARLVLGRQREEGALSLDWDVQLGALYFHVLPGFQGVPKMSKSIPGSAIHLQMDESLLRERICSANDADQEAIWAAVELASGWSPSAITEARRAFEARTDDPDAWRLVREAYLATFVELAVRWRRAIAG
jgi:hypothetical protein